MSNIKEVQFGKKQSAPEGAAQTLRDIADAMDRGEVTEFVGAWVTDDNYCFLLAASPQNSLVLATLMHTRVIGKFSA